MANQNPGIKIPGTKTCHAEVRRAIQQIVQRLGTSSKPTWDTIALTALLTDRLVRSNGDKELASTIISDWLTGTTNQISVSNDGDGTATLSTPQDTHTGANFSVASLTTSTYRVKNVKRITSADSPYAATAADHIILADTDGGAIEIDLPAGAAGRELSFANVGSSGNDLTLDPNGSESIVGEAAGDPFVLFDYESLTVVYNATEGWR